MTQVRRSTTSATSSTRGVLSNGSTPSGVYKTIDYITMASAGKAINFGDSAVAAENRTGLTNTIRGVFAGSLTPGPVRSDDIDYVTIASTGDAVDFGDLSVPRRAGGGASDSHGGLGGF